MAYQRSRAVSYAHQWAYGRNPKYFNFEDIGGDCTNFISQCLYAGAGVMNFTRDTGWYYRSPADRAAAWSGVPYLYNFLTRSAVSAGPYARVVELSDALPGDVIQLSFAGGVYGHSLMIVSHNGGSDPAGVLIATHTFNADNRPLSSYTYQQRRVLHIEGVRSA